MAPRTCDHRSRCALRALLAAAVTMSASFVLAAPTAIAGKSATQAAAGTHFSELAELTPANVRGLMPLVARSAAVTLREQRPAGHQQLSQRQLQVDTAASVDLRLQRFVEERVQSELASEQAVNLQLLGGRLSSAVSYVRDSSELRAWDPVQQRVRWSVRDALPGSARTLVTAGGLVFYGTRDGWLKALDARTGRELWKHRVPDARLAEARSYRGPDGHQYIAVRSMPGNLQGQGERESMLVFALAH